MKFKIVKARLWGVPFMTLEGILGHPLVRRSAILRKGSTFAFEPMLKLQRRAFNPSDFDTAPPIVVNSLPKSGTPWGWFGGVANLLRGFGEMRRNRDRRSST